MMTTEKEKDIFSDTAGESQEENIPDTESNDKKSIALSNDELDEIYCGKAPVWDGHYAELKLHMSTHYPNGGFVACCNCSKALGDWVGWQRLWYRDNKLDIERTKKLEDLGFLWHDTEEEKEPTEEDDTKETTKAIDNATSDIRISEEHSSDKNASDAESNEDNAADAESNDENATEVEVSNMKSNEKKDSSSENKSDSNSRSDGDQNENLHPWDRQFNNLERLMQYAYPNGGYVAASKSPSAQLRHWILHQRCQYRKMIAGKRSTISTERIRKLESLGFWWEADQIVNNDTEAEANVESSMVKANDENEILSESQSDSAPGPDERLSKADQRVMNVTNAEANDENAANLIVNSNDKNDTSSDSESDSTPGSDERLLETDQTVKNVTDAEAIDENREKKVEESNVNSSDKNDSSNDSGSDAAPGPDGDHKGTVTAWDRQCKSLELYMESAYPNGGYVAPSTCPGALGNWVTTQRWQYRRMKAGKPHKIKTDQIRKLESLGFWWEADQNVNNDTTAEANDEITANIEANVHSKDTNDTSSDSESHSMPGPDGHHNGVMASWDRQLNDLKCYMESAYPDGGYVGVAACPGALGSWVKIQRWQYRRKKAGKPHKITTEEIQKLESLGFWWENDEPIKQSIPKLMRPTGNSQWNGYFNKLKDFMKKKGIDETGGFVDARWCKKGFSNWVIKQRDDYCLQTLGKDSDITDEQIKRLESIGFHWRMDDTQSQGSDLEPSNVGRPSRANRKRTIPQPSPAAKKRQAVSRTKRVLVAARRGKKISWDEHFENLRRKMETHCPNGGYYAPDSSDTKFQTWVGNQRLYGRRKLNEKPSQMTDEHLAKLESIGFNFENPEMVATADASSNDSDKDGTSKSGSSDDSDSGDDEPNPRGQRRRNLRSSRTKQPSYVAKKRLLITWDANFQKLVRHMRRHYPQGGFVRPSRADKKLYSWIYIQRYQHAKRLQGKYSTLNDDRIKKLESLGFRWTEEEEEESNSKTQEVEQTTRGGKISWDTHYEKLVRFMKKNCPNGGFVRPPTLDKRFYCWVCTQRSQYRKRNNGKPSDLTDDRFEKLEQLGFLWEQPEESEDSAGSDSEEEDDESKSRVEDSSSSSEEDDDSEAKNSEASTSGEEEDEPGTDQGRVLARRKSATASVRQRVDSVSKSSHYKSMGKSELLRLFLNQVDHVEMLRKEKAALQSELKPAGKNGNSKFKARMLKSEEKNQHLQDTIRELKSENQDLAECNKNLRQSHQTAMLEEREHIGHETRKRKMAEDQLEQETKKRKLVEDQLEKAKQLIPMELDSACFS